MIISIINMIKSKFRIVLNALPYPLNLVILKIMQRFPKLNRINLYFLDLSVINLIRTKSSDFLSNSELIETDLLPKLGFSNESLEWYPKELQPFCGKGLLSWQLPNQFSKYLVQLSRYKIESYLEIGTRHGGTFIITVETLSRFNPIKKAIGVDIEYFPSLILYRTMNPKIQYKQMDTQSNKFKKFLKNQLGFDLVLIDGSHKEINCQNDFNNIKQKANIIVFHDILDKDLGPIKVWEDIKNNYANEYSFYEYTEQYDSVLEYLGVKIFGIGVAVKKNFHTIS